MVDTHPVSSGADPVRWNPLVVLDDPYPTYRRLRDEAPLYHDEALDLWAFTRYDDVQSAARTGRPFRAARRAATTWITVPSCSSRPAIWPASTRRARAAPRRAPSGVQAVPGRDPLRAVVREAVIRLIDRFADRGSADFARELARPLPAEMFCSWLGFPGRSSPSDSTCLAGCSPRRGAARPARHGRSPPATRCTTTSGSRPPNDGQRHATIS